VLWFKTGWFVSDKIYRKAGRGANGEGCNDHVPFAIGICYLA
jgi:hypothetical protein